MSIRNPLLFDDGLKPSRGTATTQYPEGLFRKGLDSLTLAAFESALGFYGVDEQGFFQSMIDRLIHHHRISQSSNGHSISRLNIPFRLGWNNHPGENRKIRRLDEIADFCFKPTGLVSISRKIKNTRPGGFQFLGTATHSDS